MHRDMTTYRIFIIGIILILLGLLLANEVGAQSVDVVPRDPPPGQEIEQNVFLPLMTRFGSGGTIPPISAISDPGIPAQPEIVPGDPLPIEPQSPLTFYMPLVMRDSNGPVDDTPVVDVVVLTCAVNPGNCSEPYVGASVFVETDTGQIYTGTTDSDGRLQFNDVRARNVYFKVCTVSGLTCLEKDRVVTGAMSVIGDRFPLPINE